MDASDRSGEYEQGSDGKELPKATTRTSQSIDVRRSPREQLESVRMVAIAEVEGQCRCRWFGTCKPSGGWNEIAHA